jgi:hypothetical protein
VLTSASNVLQPIGVGYESLATSAKVLLTTKGGMLVHHQNYILRVGRFRRQAERIHQAWVLCAERDEEYLILFQMDQSVPDITDIGPRPHRAYWRCGVNNRSSHGRIVRGLRFLSPSHPIRHQTHILREPLIAHLDR